MLPPILFSSFLGRGLYRLSLLTTRICQRAHTAEADVGTGLILIFAATPSRADIALGVFPRTTTHTLLLQTIGVFQSSVVLQLRVDIVLITFFKL